LPLLTSIIGLCRAVGLPVVAEGIEDDNVVEHLIASGCAYGQGYALGEPQPAALLSQRHSGGAPVPEPRLVLPQPAGSPPGGKPPTPR